MEALLRALLPCLLPRDRTFEVRVFQGKRDLLKKLESRLRAYATWLPDDHRVGLRKVEAARAIAAHIDPARNRSQSFGVFVGAIREATA